MVGRARSGVSVGLLPESQRVLRQALHSRSMIRKRTASFLSGVLVASSIPFVGVAAFAPPAHATTACSAEFEATEPDEDGDSYVIASEENLNYLLQQFNSVGFDLRSASFIQSRDLDMNGCSVTRPMADSLSNAFQGSYNGAGFEIADLVIDASALASPFVGLFGYLGNASSEGSISNLGFSGVVSNDGSGGASQGTGGLVGYLYWGSVSNSYTTGSVTGSYQVGGLVGYQNPASRSATISDSWSSANVKANAAGDFRFGGLVGALIGGSISTSYATGTVGSSDKRPDYVGGLVGTAQQASEIQESFATGAVFGGDGVGGLIGAASSTSGNPEVLASYARGAVNGTGTAVGGLFGLCSRGDVQQSYVTSPVTGPTSGVLADYVGAVIGNRTTGNCAPTDPNTLWNADTAIATTNQGAGSYQVTPLGNVTQSNTEAMTNVDTYLDTSIVDTAWSIGSGWDSSGTKTWGICSAFNDAYPFLNALYSSDPCTGSGGGGGSASGNGPPAEFEFTFWLPDGSECTSIGPVIVVDGTSYTLPGVDADCRTMPGALVGGWTIPVEPGFTGAGSSSLPFQPDHVVEVSGSQQFTVVPYEPVLVIELDANVDFVDTCVPTDVEHQSPDHMFRYKWVPRELISLARLPERASCEAPGYRLVGWNAEADGTGTTFELEGPIPDEWGTAPPNSHHLFGMWERIA